MGPSFRLLTANLLNGRADPRLFGESLDRLAPDIVVTQELGPDAAEAIADRYPGHDLHPGLDHRGIGIASRFEAEYGSLDLPWREGRWARIDIGSRVLVVATVHLINPIEFPWWVSVRKRTDQLEALATWAKDEVGKEAMVVAGDMNASPSWPAYTFLADRWDDLVVEAAQVSGSDPESTWGWRPGWPRMLRIDHVFGRGVEALATSVEAVRGSDHDAVVVELMFR
jgi:endonuclease/exonuclease/phosphatase (EEP) superfamily protein YafD